MSTDIRTRLVALAKTYDGVSVATARAKYLALVAAGETPEMAAYMALPKTSGCALFIRGLWRALGLDEPELKPPYFSPPPYGPGRRKPGLAVSDVVTIARRYGAWVTDVRRRRPELGDVPLVGGDRVKDGGVEHVYGVTLSNGDVLHSIDGGQVVGGAQAIASKIRTWEQRRDGSVWDRSRLSTDPGSGAPRRVMGWVDVSKLPFPLELAAPVPSSAGGHELAPRPTIKRGDKLPDVGAWQRILGASPKPRDWPGTWGWPLKPDNDFGERTETATKWWQTVRGLEVTGVVDAATWASARGT